MDRVEHPRRGAFTLIELILVMALLLIVISMSAPMLKTFFRGRTLDSEARRFLGLTRYAQSRAVAEGMPMLLWVDPEQRTYGLQVELADTRTSMIDEDVHEKEFSLAKDVQIEVLPSTFTAYPGTNTRAAQLDGANGLNTLRFTPDGFIAETNPGGIQIKEGENNEVWIIPSRNRLYYEIATNNPAFLRR